MKEQSDAEYELIGKFLSGEMLGKDQQNFEDWLNESDENKNLFETLKQFDNYTKIYKDIRNLDVLKAKNLTWYRILKQSRFKEQIENESSEFFNKLYFKRFLLYAATIAILTAVAFWMFYATHKTTNTLTYTQITAPKGSRTNLTLADGSSVWLNSGSVLKYDNKFNDKDRSVYLEGEAFFEVAKNAAKPFYVKTNDLIMKVLGTSFNVKAYKEEGTVQTTLVTGAMVIQRNNSSDVAGMVFLKPNQKAIFIKKQDQLVLDTSINKKIVSNADKKTIISEKVAPKPVLKQNAIIINDDINIEQDISWKDGYMVIKQESLEDLAVKLSRQYDVVFNFESKDIKKYRYTGKLYNLTLDQVLNAIKFSSPIDFRIDKKNVTISKKL